MLPARTRCGLAMLLMLSTVALSGCQGGGTGAPGEPAAPGGGAPAASTPPVDKTPPADAKRNPSKDAFCKGFQDYVDWAQGDEVQGKILVLGPGTTERLTPLKSVVPDEVSAELDSVIAFYSVFDPKSGSKGPQEGQPGVTDSMVRIAEFCGL